LPWFGVLAFSGGGGLALAIPYTIPNVTTTAHRLQSTPLRPAWIRSPGRLQNTFANESFLDQIAAAIGTDPLGIRLQHLNDARGKASRAPCPAQQVARA
jgi:CO/xanthine dehydrogenase Mo-binding subunit